MSSATWLAANHALFVSIFDSPVGGDYRLYDTAPQAAWRQVIGGG